MTGTGLVGDDSDMEVGNGLCRLRTMWFFSSLNRCCTCKRQEEGIVGEEGQGCLVQKDNNKGVVNPESRSFSGEMWLSGFH